MLHTYKPANTSKEKSNSLEQVLTLHKHVCPHRGGQTPQAAGGVLSGHTEEMQQIGSQLKSTRKDLLEAGLKRKRV